MYLGSLHLGEERPGPFVFMLLRYIPVGHRADYESRAIIAIGMSDRRPHLHIDEFAPWLSVAGEPLHEAGVAVFAGVAAADIGVDRVADDRKVGLGQNAFDLYLLDDHLSAPYHSHI